jgi:hypothetical protein
MARVNAAMQKTAIDRYMGNTTCFAGPLQTGLSLSVSRCMCLLCGGHRPTDQHVGGLWYCYQDDRRLDAQIRLWGQLLVYAHHVVHPQYRAQQTLDGLLHLYPDLRNK